MSNLLLITILLPLAGALLCLGDRSRVRWVALAATTAALLAAGVLVFSFPRSNETVGWAPPTNNASATASNTPLVGGAHPTVYAASDFSFGGDSSSPAGLRLSLGLDGLSLWFFGLVGLLGWVAVLISWEAITDQAARYYRLLLLLTAGMFGLFAARDIILFYVCFEFTLVPLFLLIGVWGSQDRRRAAIKFFLFTLVGSLIALLGLLAIVLWDFHHSPTGELTFSIDRLTEHLTAAPLPLNMQLWLFAALFAGFAIKVPLVPFHTWLPLAHVEAPTAGSVLLAGVLLKLGTYGFL
ncbi:MAG TPA: proton-conducting transporter membrane subunit, partial [Thermoguttaceae bacterium]|nr:proton-conducting transporter membrane subunit [Thermoguttaceae bacterium]